MNTYMQSPAGERRDRDLIAEFTDLNEAERERIMAIAAWIRLRLKQENTLARISEEALVPLVMRYLYGNLTA